MNKLIKNFIKTKKYDEIKSILASKNSYNLLGLHHAITSFDLEAYKLIIISYANPSHFISAKYDRYIYNIDDTSMLDVAAFINFDTIQYRDTKSSMLQELIQFKKRAIEEQNNNAISELKIEGFELKN
ncbi:hypothetical protein MCC_02815 [Rickettsia rhipicephali str. 3-7-female6-CWPP]|uniref:Uncharacterized protein n=1 Tax=Rickettsia rhipicephali (strain 3-7-female6-CWPP) TaxID=1105113 RepID=A0AAI8F6C0_RICR3|nr:hypothetical protein [Rickettsia rhipicephali]AFC72174.1 hypothetical protein MCC_02815 [Rickettsia rhipicephali str. 3-7-female6-CWPP]